MVGGVLCTEKSKSGRVGKFVGVLMEGEDRGDTGGGVEQAELCVCAWVGEGSCDWKEKEEVGLGGVE